MIAKLLRRLGRPAEVTGSLPADVAVIRNQWIPALGGRLAGMRGPAAVTLGRTIVLHPAVDATPRLIRHELAHVRQWLARPLVFPLHYAWLHVRHGYRDNPYEVEARGAEAGPGRSPQ